MRKFIEKIVLVLFSLFVSATLTFIVYGVFLDYATNNFVLDPLSYKNIYLFYAIFIALPILVALGIFALNFILIMKLTRRFPKLIVGLILVIVLGLMFLFKPFKIFGGDVGQYKNGQIVLALVNIGQTKLYDTVVFRRPGSFSDGTAYVEGVPGQKVENTYYFNNEKLEGNIVPAGYYAVRFGDNKHLRLVPKSSITFIVWYPFKKPIW